MKYILLTFLLTSSFYSLASTHHLKCLGVEESYIHKNKIGGAFKKLNQAMINELIMLSDTVTMKKEFLDKICAQNTKYPSLELLKLSFMGENLFYSEVKTKESRQFNIDRVAIENFKKTSKHIFIGFLTNLHSEVSDPKCLEKEFPLLKDYFLRTKYILMDIGIKKLTAEIKNKSSFFNKLKTLNWMKNCQDKE